MDTPKTVTVRSIEWHTYHGKAYPVGATYEAEATIVESLVAQRKAVPVDAPAAPAPKPSQPVEPMTLQDKSVRTSQS